MVAIVSLLVLRSAGQSPRAAGECLVLGRGGGGEREVEDNIRIRRIDACRLDVRRIRLADDGGDQVVAGRVGEVVMQIGIAIDVDLRGELAIAVRGHEEVDVRRALAMPADRLQQLVGRTAFGDAIAMRDYAAERIETFGIGLDAAAHVVVALALVEVAVIALRVGVPDVNDGICDRFPFGIAHLAMHDERLAHIAAIVDTRARFDDRCAGHIERPLDGAGRSFGHAGCAILGVRADVEEALETEAGRPEAEFVRTGGEEVERMPELVFRDIKAIDRIEQIGDYLAQDLPGALAARRARIVDAGDLVEEGLDLGGLGELGHAISSQAVSLCSSRTRRPEGQRSSSWIEEGWRQSGVTFISMKGKSGRLIRMSWSSPLLSTSKILTFA